MSEDEEIEGIEAPFRRNSGFDKDYAEAAVGLRQFEFDGDCLTATYHPGKEEVAGLINALRWGRMGVEDFVAKEGAKLLRAPAKLHGVKLYLDRKQMEACLSPHGEEPAHGGEAWIDLSTGQIHLKGPRDFRALWVEMGKWYFCASAGSDIKMAEKFAEWCEDKWVE
jgi:hypothetical protein